MALSTSSAVKLNTDYVWSEEKMEMAFCSADIVRSFHIKCIEIHM